MSKNKNKKDLTMKIKRRSSFFITHCKLKCNAPKEVLPSPLNTPISPKFTAPRIFPPGAQAPPSHT